MMACGRCAEACAVTVRAEATALQGQRIFYVYQRVLTQQWVTLTAVTVPAKRHTAISLL
jgi:hypothetical protein